jgi:hypothetical protein
MQHIKPSETHHKSLFSVGISTHQILNSDPYKFELGLYLAGKIFVSLIYHDLDITVMYLPSSP